MEGVSEEKKGKTYMQWIVAILANATLLIQGMQSSWISPTRKLLQSTESPSGQPLSDYEISWVASSIALVACFGVPIFAYLADRIGRKKSIILITFFQALCWIFNIFSSSTTNLLIGRFFAGLASGACYNVIPMYVREISQEDMRGILGSFLVLQQNIGILIMFAIGFYMNYYVVLYICAFIAVVTLVMMLFIPEAPAFLVKREEIYQAAATLSTLRGLNSNHTNIQKEIDYMKNEENVYKTMPKISYLDIWRNKAWRRGCFLNMMLMTTRSLSGTFALITYTPAILSASGVSVNAEVQALSFPVVMIVASVISMSCVEKFGRKPILIWTFVIATLSLCILATTMLLQTYGKPTPTWIPATAIVIYMCAYAGGISPMPYIVMAEMFNFQIRARVVGIFSTYAWFLTFIQLVAFTAVCNIIGDHNVFYCYAGINLLGVFVSVVLLMETKGKTVEEIEMDLIVEKSDVK